MSTPRLDYYPAAGNIEDSIALIRRSVEESLKDGDVLVLTRQIVGDCPSRDDMCEMRAVFDWTRRNIRYTYDPVGMWNARKRGFSQIDVFATARRIIESRGADCDESGATLMTVFGKFLGHPTAVRVVGFAPDSWDHIYTLWGAPRENPTTWIPMDPTLPIPDAGPGIEPLPPYVKRSRDWLI